MGSPSSHGVMWSPSSVPIQLSTRIRRSFCLTSQIDREAAAIRLLDWWPWKAGGCLIGGYAVAAYGKPRFSQDVDLVLPESQRRPSIARLEAEGFSIRSSKRVHSSFRDAATLLRGDFTVDLMFGSVRDRESGASIQEAWISDLPRRTKLDLLTGTTTEEIPVARPAAMWVLKLLAGRDQDLSDLFAISGEPFEVPEVRQELENIMNPTLRTKLSEIRARVRTTKIYSDALSARSMGKQGEPQNVRAWARFRGLLDLALPT